MIVDIHSHILPGVDDGATSLREAVQMAEAALRAGVTHVIATPHIIDGLNPERVAEIKSSFYHFQKKLSDLGILLKVYPGAEIHLHDDLLKEGKLDNFLTLAQGGKYLLIELPVYQSPLIADKVLSSLLDKGLIPIIAHPERNETIQKNTDLLRKWVNAGVTTQVTAEALLGFWGSKKKRLVKTLMAQDLVHFLATDCHSVRHRPFSQLGLAYRVLHNWLGREELLRFHWNARAVFEGNSLRRHSRRQC